MPDGAAQPRHVAPRPASLAAFAAAHAWQTNAALLLIGVLLLWITHTFVQENNGWIVGFDRESGYSALLYCGAALIILRAPVDRWTMPIIIGVFLLLRFETLLGEPFLSSDIYRYAWDGMVQHHGINPYRYVPGDPALAWLRKPNQDLFDSINRRDYAHTIYPPAAQWFFFLVAFFDTSVTGMKLAMIAMEAVTATALIALLRRLGLRREQALLYLWCPLLAWEIGSSGHVDSLAMAWIACALLFRFPVGPRVTSTAADRRNAWLTGLFLGLATMTKFFPIALFPALYRRWDWRMPVALVGTIVAGYASYASVGWGVFGFLGGYAHEEGIDTGTRFFLLEGVERWLHPAWFADKAAMAVKHPAADRAYLLCLLLVLGGCALWTLLTVARPLTERPQGLALARALGLPPAADYLASAALLGLVMMLLFSPHYPWYAAWLVLFMTLVPDLTLFVYTLGLYYMCTTYLAEGQGPKQFRLNQILYGGTALAFVLDALLRRWPVHRRWLHVHAAETAIAHNEAGLRITELPNSAAERRA